MEKYILTNVDINIGNQNKEKIIENEISKNE